MARKAGRIITIGSIAGLFGRDDGAIYAVAKAAVHEYTRCLATQLRPYNVTVKRDFKLRKRRIKSNEGDRLL